MTEETLPFSTRLWFAFVCWFRVLFDAVFARRVFDAAHRATLPAPRLERPPELAAARVAPSAPATTKTPTDSALQLLALMQREGRLVDFLQQEIATFSDSDIGAAARVVHAGCRKALKEHTDLVPVVDQPENSPITLASDFDMAAIKLTGNVQGSAPYRGVLRHRGWRANSFTLPAVVSGYDVHLLAPAEVEL